MHLSAHLVALRCFDRLDLGLGLEPAGLGLGGLAGDGPAVSIVPLGPEDTDGCGSLPSGEGPGCSI
jgi:hypothetical protein